jgi:Fe-S-cluster containining protein
MTVRCLTFHARYACRDSGACCTAGWPIPIEADRLATIAAAVGDGRLVPPSLARPLWIQPADAPPSMPAALQFDDRGCVFHESRDGGRCRIHRVLGHGALPLACRQFPRVSVVDPRGASVTLSHYCPTAASLLDKHVEIAITAEPPAFPKDSEIVGLDVRTSLPPLLRPDMLMDWEAWSQWECRAVETIARPDETPQQALATLSAAVERVRMWTPDDGPLLARIGDAFMCAAEHSSGRATREAPAFGSALSDALAAIPDDLRPQELDHAGPPSVAAARAFLAAHAFANWTAHLGQGLRSWLRSIEAAWSLANELGVRQTDLILRHLADSDHLARTWSRAEHDH